MRVPIESVRANRTLLGDIFASYQRGETTHQEYVIANARWAADNVDQYRVLAYPHMPDLARRYCELRLSEGRSYSASEAGILGEWVKLMIDAREENLARCENLKWCREKLIEVEMIDSARRCENQILQLQSVRFPHESFSEALRVKEKDQREKARIRSGQVNR